ncbi:hypothetical protein GJAV_G00168520 [Gymnothorax javanicus]|nr:hypothetical protein GJAV_G00168520 [Gymnothorax javanicus]
MNGFIAFALIYLTFVAIPLEGRALRCSCVKKDIQRSFIPSRYIDDVKLIPAGAHCERPEVIISVKEMRVCADPSARWVQRLIKSKQKEQMELEKSRSG